MRKLCEALEKATNKTMDSCNSKKFVNCYPPSLTSKYPELFATAHERFLTILRQNIKDELAIVCDKYELAAKLQMIDQWKESQEEEQIKSHSLEPLGSSPLALATAMELESKNQEREKLLQILQELEKQRDTLQLETEAKLQKQEELQRKAAARMEQVDKAVAVCKQWASSDTREWTQQTS